MELLRASAQPITEQGLKRLEVVVSISGLMKSTSDGALNADLSWLVRA